MLQDREITKTTRMRPRPEAIELKNTNVRPQSAIKHEPYPEKKWQAENQCIRLQITLHVYFVSPHKCASIGSRMQGSAPTTKVAPDY